MNKKILLVEDEPSMAKLTTIHLEMYGFVVFHAVSGEEAVLKVTPNNEINLILMDIDLGLGISGFEAATKIQKKSNTPTHWLTKNHTT